MVRRLTFWIVLAFISHAPGTSAVALEQAELDASQAIWMEQGLDEYGFRFKRDCFCFGEYVREVILRVEDGKVISATDTETHLGFDVNLFLSVEEIFAELQRAIDYPANAISAEFDPESGYPTNVYIDLDIRIADEEVGYTASDVSADLTLPACAPEVDRSCAGPLIDTLARPVFGFDTFFLDYTEDGVVDAADRMFLINKILKTTLGDSNLDGMFDSSDMVTVFQAGQYEDVATGNSGWETGDWNGDLDFTSSDLVAAFRTGSYEANNANAQVVPEPSSLFFLLTSLVLLAHTRRVRASRH